MLSTSAFPVGLSRRGTARVSIHRRVPFRPTIWNSSCASSPPMTRAMRSRKARRYSGATIGSTTCPRTISILSASIIRSPAGFMSRPLPPLVLGVAPLGVEVGRTRRARGPRFGDAHDARGLVGLEITRHLPLLGFAHRPQHHAHGLGGRLGLRKGARHRVLQAEEPLG